MTDDLEGLGPGDHVVVAGPTPETVLVLGERGADLGEPLGTAAPQLVRRFLDAAGLSGAAMSAYGLTNGNWVRLTDQSARLVEERGDFMRDKQEVALGLIRGDQGRIEHVVRFTPAAFEAVAAGALLSSLVTQFRLARIERSLVDLTQRVDTLIEGSKIEVEARLAAVLDTIRRIERRERDRERVDDRDWASLAEIEPTVKEIYHQTVRWLDPLRGALDDQHVSLAEQVRLLKGNLGIRDVGFWLRMYAYSELAVKRWELLYLLHEADAAPEHLANEAQFLDLRAEERRADLTDLYDSLADYLDSPGRLSRWERIRVISRVRLARLRFELGHVVNAYADALGRARREVPEFVPDDPESDRGPIIDVEALRDEMREIAGDAVKASTEGARKAGRASADAARRIGEAAGEATRRATSWFERRSDAGEEDGGDHGP